MGKVGERMIKAIVFDLDHTLFDRYATMKLVVPSFKDGFCLNPGITDRFIYDELSYADKQYVHKGWENIYKHLCEKGIFKVEPGYDEYVKYVISQFRKYAVIYPFTKSVLSEIRSQGFKIGLITNGDHQTQTSKLQMLGIGEFFDEIIISGDTLYQKPQVEIFKLMAQRLGIETAEMMYVGDHPKFDVDGSRNAGCVPVWVRTTGTWIFPEIEKPKLQVDSVEYLPAITKKFI